MHLRGVPAIAIIDDLCGRSGQGARAATTRPSVRLVDPGVPCEPGVIGVADRAMGAFEKHRAAPKALAIGLDAGGIARPVCGQLTMTIPM